MAIQKRLVGKVSSPSGPIPIYETHITNILWVFRCKPANSDFTAHEWVIAASCWGIPTALAKCFMQWCIDNKMNHRHLFGEAGKTCAAIAHLEPASDEAEFKAAWKHFTDEMLATQWNIDELGDFGDWFRKARLPESLIDEVLRQYLTR